MSKGYKIIVSEEEFHTILAALRFYQKHDQGDPEQREEWINRLATNDESFNGLDTDEIDELAVRINLESIETHGNF
jgi:hypothetical protein